MQDSNNSNELNGHPVDQDSELTAMAYNMECKICYPDVYYKIQPFVMSLCDQMHSRDESVFSQEMFDQISDNIYADVVNTYPDLVEYASCQDMKSSVESLQRYYDEYGRDRDYDRDRRDRDYDRDRRDRDYDRDRRGRYRFRRRGIFRDFIDLLLLNELIRRGRYYPYYPYYPYNY